MRVTCSIEGLEQNWVEFTDRWTRAEQRELTDANDETWFALFRRKATACNLALEDGTVITNPAQVTPDAVEGMDLRLVGFLGASMTWVCAELRVLGNASRRLSSNGVAPTTKTLAAASPTQS